MAMAVCACVRVCVCECVRKCMVGVRIGYARASYVLGYHPFFSGCEYPISFFSFAPHTPGGFHVLQDHLCTVLVLGQTSKQC